MANHSALRKIDTPEPALPAPREWRDPRFDSPDELVRKLLKAGNSNEIAEVIGLQPITGLSGPNLFY